VLHRQDQLIREAQVSQCVLACVRACVRLWQTRITLHKQTFLSSGVVMR
jgi:hypothetical protein